MFFFNTLNQSESLTPLLLLLIALIVNIFLGQNSLFGHLKGYSLNTLSKIIAWFDLKLNRENRSPLDRAVRGGLTTILVLLLSVIFGLVVIWLSTNLPFAWLFELLLILMVLDQSNTYKNVLEIKKPVVAGFFCQSSLITGMPSRRLRRHLRIHRGADVLQGHSQFFGRDQALDR